MDAGGRGALIRCLVPGKEGTIERGPGRLLRDDSGRETPKKKHPIGKETHKKDKRQGKGKGEGEEGGRRGASRVEVKGKEGEEEEGEVVVSSQEGG